MKVIRSVLSVLAVLLMLVGLVSWFGSTFNILLLLGLVLGFLAWLLPWAARRVSPETWAATGLLVLAGLIVPSSSIMADREPGIASTFVFATLFLLPSLATVNAALLLQAGLALQTGRLAAACLVLAGVLVFKTLHNLYELTVWDSTYDPLTYFWLIPPIFAVLLSVLMLFNLLPHKTKLTGLIFLVLIPASMIGTSSLAQRVDFREVTEKDAERTVRAIESFFAREGRYPDALSELVPRYLLSVPEPMIIYGQDWCYESGQKYYRFGYIDRGHWSDPRLVGRVYSAAGAVPGTSPMCMEEFNAIQSRDPGFPYTYLEESQ